MSNEVTTSGTIKPPAAVEERLGFETTITQEDLIIPRAVLFQGNPTQADKFPEARGGQILNSLTTEVLSETFVPVFVDIEWIKFNKRKPEEEGFDPAFEPGAIIWRTKNAGDPLLLAEAEQWRFKTMTFLCKFDGSDMPVLVTFRSTSFTAGKKLLSLAQFCGGNMFSRKYKLFSKKETKDGDIYYILQVSPAGVASAEDQAVCRGWYQSFRGKALQVHEDKNVNWEE